MRLAAGWYTGARRGDGRLDDIYVYADGTARRGTVNSDGACVHVGCPQVDLDDYVCVAASEPSAARADDGARVEAGAESRADRGVRLLRRATMTTVVLAPGLYKLRARCGRLDEVCVNEDGAARRFAPWGPEPVCLTEYTCEVNLNERLAVAASEPSAARADDGARVEAGAARAEEGHGWSVSATRTIGNAFERAATEAMLGAGLNAEGYGWLRSRIATGTLTAADLDAVRDEPVMPDEGDVRGRAASFVILDDCVTPPEDDCGESYVAFKSLAPPVLPRDPSPGKCQTCGVQRRERGEVRVHYWKCSCAVKPDEVYEWHGSGETLWRARSWVTPNTCVMGEHPLREGAVAEWRKALGDYQRWEDDGCRQ